MDLSRCIVLEEVPDLAKATKLEKLALSMCKNLREIPHLSKATKLKKLDLCGCESLEVLPTDVNLVSLEVLILVRCKRLRSFPQLSTNIRTLNLYGTAIEEVPSWIENMPKLKELDMSDCKRLKIISVGIFKLRNLKTAYFRACSELTSFSDSSVVAGINDSLDFASNDLKHFRFLNCFNLDQDAQELILRLSIPMFTFLPGEEVPTYFTHRTCAGSSLSITLPLSSPSHEVLRLKACIVTGPPNNFDRKFDGLKVGWRFRGLSGVKLFNTFCYTLDHMLVFNFGLADFELNSHLSSSVAIDHMSSHSVSDYNVMEFEVFVSENYGRYHKIGIKGCGIRLLNASLR